MTFSLRIASDADLPALGAVAAAMGHRHETGYFARCLAEQAAGRRQVFVAAGDGGILGYVQLNRAPLYPLFRRLNLPEIQDLCVIPAARRQGVGEALVRHCEETARAAGDATIAISVGLHAAFGAAQRLYVRLGYVPDGFGVAYDDQSVTAGDIKPVDDLLTLKLTKDL